MVFSALFLSSALVKCTHPRVHFPPLVTYILVGLTVIDVNGAVANEEVKSRISWTERVQSPIWHHPFKVFQTHKSISINKIKRTVMHEYSVSRQGITASAPYLQRTLTPMA